MTAAQRGPFLQASDGARNVIGARLTVGRDAERDLTVDIDRVSRRHAEISCRNGVCRLTDLGSRNGTFVNGTRVGVDDDAADAGARGTLLADGDEIVLGGAVRLVFRDPMATPIAPRIGRLTGVWVDPDSRAVWVDATRVEPPLSTKQLCLLELLLRHDGEIVTRQRIIEEVWPDDAIGGVSDQAVAAIIKRLRARLHDVDDLHGRDADGDELIDVVRGRGVRLRQR